jgi:hypothetical protein
MNSRFPNATSSSVLGLAGGVRVRLVFSSFFRLSRLLVLMQAGVACCRRISVVDHLVLIVNYVLAGVGGSGRDIFAGCIIVSWIIARKIDCVVLTIVCDPVLLFSCIPIMRLLVISTVCHA